MTVTNPESEKPDCSLLIKRIVAGCKRSEIDLVKKYSRATTLIVYGRVKDWHLAADLSQDTLLLVIENARKGKINAPEKLSAYIRQIAINLVIAYFRKERRRATQTDSELIETFCSESCIATQLATKQLTHFIKECIAELENPRDQDILNQFYLFEQPKAVICQHLQLSPEHFDRVIYRARQRLKSKLQEKAQGHSFRFNSLDVLIIVNLTLNLHQSITCENSSKLVKTMREYSPSHHILLESSKAPLKVWSTI